MCGVRAAMEGSGTFSWVDAEGAVSREYTGEWHEGEMHGEGTLWMGDGNGSYQGQFQRGHMHGKGVRRFWNGDSCRGEWAGSKMHGSGVYEWASGDAQQYFGQFAQGFAHGSGKKTWRDGTYYVGQFEGNFPSGNGLLVGAAGEDAVAGVFETAAVAEQNADVDLAFVPSHWKTPDGSVCVQQAAEQRSPRN